MADLSELVSRAPQEPGVYLMKSEEDKVIYVGKAKNIRNRVRSYFNKQAHESVKTAYLVSQIRDIEFIVAGTEMEALLLENNLIKKFKPKYNIRLRDDKTYPYIRLDVSHDFPRPYLSRRPQKDPKQLIYGPFTQAVMVHRALAMSSKVFKLRDCRDHEFSNRARPCLSYQIGQCTAPCVDYVSKDEYAQQVSEFQDFIEGKSEELEQKWQKLMDESSDKMEFEKAAFYRDQIQTLQAMTEQKQRMESAEDTISRDVWALWPNYAEDNTIETDYLDLIVLQFREGKLIGREHYPIEVVEKVFDQGLLTTLLIQYYSKKELPAEVLLPPAKIDWDYTQLQDALNHEKSTEMQLSTADQKESWAKLYDLARDNAKLVAQEQKVRRQSRKDAVKALAYFLKLEKEPAHMECIDISNLQGTANVASCVVFEHGKPKKQDYRHFNIKSFSGQDDFASMKEVITRRYGKADSKLPDLLVIDGGKGQLSAVVSMLEELEVSINVIALAKARTESDFKSSEVKTSKERIFLPGQKNAKVIKNPEVLKLMTHIRDEAHRFAINFHRKKRSQAQFE